METLKKKIKDLSRSFLPEAIQIRRHLHMYPELSTREFETAVFIAGKLKEWGIPVQENIAGTGLTGLIEGRRPAGKVVALRADMDALPIKETARHTFQSRNEGVMHACGHDVHMASLLGTAWILNRLKSDFEGTVKLIFQPSEEKYPGGAVQMIREGVLDNPPVSAIIGQHVMPTINAGMVGFRSGSFMASSDEIHLTVKGKGGHGATPELNVDAVVAASHVIIALQQLVSRMANPVIPTVLSFGRIIGDGKTNILPDEVKIDGTFRTFDEGWRVKAHEKITWMAKKTAETFGATCEVWIDPGYPFVYNDPALTEHARSAAVEFLGPDKVVGLEQRMTAEDFSYFAREIPGCFYRLGIRNEEKGIVSNLHTSAFDADESCLETGMGLMAWLALR